MDAPQPSLTDSWSILDQPSSKAIEYWRSCAECHIPFSAERAYKRHVATSQAHNPDRLFQCSICSKGFTRDDVRKKHERKLRCWPPAQESALEHVIPAKRTYSDFEIDTVEQEHPHTFVTTGEEVVDFDGLGFQFVDSSRVLREVDVMDTVTEENETAETIAMEGDRSMTNAAFAVHGASTADLESTRNENSMEANEELGRDGLMDTPELSRGNSAVSNNSSIEDLLMLDISAAWRDFETTTLVMTSSIDSGEPCEVAASANRAHKSKLNKFANKCTICKSPYETDIAELRAHLYRHLQEQKHEWLCDMCDIGFASEADLKHHLISAEQGHCGFNFRHTGLCTGHHPVSSTSNDMTLGDHDRFKLGSLLRSWELSQLQLHEASIQQLTEAKTLTGHLNQSSLSLCDAALRKRQSLSSLVYSLKTFTSEPHDASKYRDVDLDELERSFGSISLSKTANLIRQGRDKLKGMRLRNERLRQAAIRGDVSAVESHLQAGANVDFAGVRLRDFDSLTPLMLASQSGYPEVVKALLDFEASVNMRDCTGETALHKAAKAGHTNVAEKLLSKRADPGIRNSNRRTALHESVANDQSDVSQLLLTQEAVQSSLRVDGPELLHLAVNFNCVTTCQGLLDAGIDPNWRIDAGNTWIYKWNPPGIAAFPEEFSDGTSLATPYSEPLDDAPALYTASRLGLEAIVSMLLAAGANVNAAGLCGSPLGAAVANMHVEVVSILLLHQADPFDRNCWNGRDACSTAAYYDNHQVLEMILHHATATRDIPQMLLAEVLSASTEGGSFDALQVALRYGADIDTCRDGNGPPICVAASKGQLGAVRLLLNHGADVNKCDCIGSALYHAVIQEYEQLACLLLAHGANTEVCAQPSLATPLHAAALLCSAAMIDLLLENGAQPLARNSQGYSAVDLALSLNTGSFIAERPRVDAVLRILEKGAVRDHGVLVKALDVEVDLATLERIIDCGANVNERHASVQHSLQEVTPLYHAANAGLRHIVRSLKACGADFNAIVSGETALCAASRNGDLAMANFLLFGGADANLHAKIEVARLLYRRGAKPRSETLSIPSLSRTLTRGNLEVVRFLIEVATKGEVEAGRSALLHVAIRSCIDSNTHSHHLSGLLEIVDNLLEIGVSLNGLSAVAKQTLGRRAGENSVHINFVQIKHALGPCYSFG